MDGQVRGLLIKGDSGFNSLLVYQMTEEGTAREARARWVPGEGLCGVRGALVWAVSWLSIARVRAG